MKLYILLVLVMSFTNFGNCGIFDEANGHEESIKKIMETFNDNALQKYRAAMPNISMVANEVNELLDELYKSAENKRMMNQTKIRFNTFLTETKNSVNNSLKFIETGLNDVKKSSIQMTNQIFTSAKTLEAELIKKNCTEDEVINYLQPYINQTVECVRNAAKIEMFYEKNADLASKSLGNIVESVILSLEICTNKSRAGFCSQRSAFLLTRRLEEFRHIADRQFSRIEVENARNSFQKGKTCSLDTISEAQVHLKNVSCSGAASSTQENNEVKHILDIADENAIGERKFDEDFEKQIFEIINQDYQ